MQTHAHANRSLWDQLSYTSVYFRRLERIMQNTYFGESGDGALLTITWTGYGEA